MTHTITRGFNHRTFGEIGTATLVADVTKVTLNGKELPEASVEYLLNFALQSLQDSYAGAKDQAEAQGNFGKKTDAIINGTLGQRASGGGVSDFVKVARSIVKALLKAKGKDVKSVTDEQLDGVFEKNAEVLRPKVEAEIKRRNAEKAAKAKIGEGIDLDI